jgi:hypothetical protein
MVRGLFRSAVLTQTRPSLGRTHTSNKTSNPACPTSGRIRFLRGYVRTSWPPPTPLRGGWSHSPPVAWGEAHPRRAGPCLCSLTSADRGRRAKMVLAGGCAASGAGGRCAGRGDRCVVVRRQCVEGATACTCTRYGLTHSPGFKRSVRETHARLDARTSYRKDHPLEAHDLCSFHASSMAR